MTDLIYQLSIINYQSSITNRQSSIISLLPSRRPVTELGGLLTFALHVRASDDSPDPEHKRVLAFKALKPSKLTMHVGPRLERYCFSLL
jgi:hypothetical protein